ncbi:toll/interleukin-1 receptor domain-containing protein [Alteromonas sp. ASW11-36]|uniref:Toll/interleukin-1 receptor domain-containing protein n=1 Tax=Alteromonas arenosi TaxID=3055817 RepID=A0ABT7SY66_9ALTE|nr:toll/interleukin-1 receptor domain-containing protein [Alteromonas sp. ASW11-36]MDM7861130.1 toll/interleukin-1 receptor domain-containing protein [Alteromonas sp. ASW11-36]
MTTEVLGRTYRAFISYRHADNKAAGRQWATWLHQAIETYEVPDDLVGTKNQRGEEIPARIFPIFRDEEELPAHADLGNAITLALDHTETLIVLCSPNAVQSTYVADEIRYFKQLGRSDRIIAAIIEGEPNTSWDTSKEALGFSPQDECFPVPLQFEYDENGQTEKRAEPIAADFRVNAQGKPYQGWTSPEAYRSWLLERGEETTAIATKVEAYTAQLNLMRLKIIAGILGIPLGHLTKRDQAYQLAQEKERAKKLRRWLTAVGMLAVIAISTGIWAWMQRQVALENEQIAVERLQERQIADANRLTNEAIEYLDDGNVEGTLERLDDAIPEDIANPEWPISDRTATVLNRAVALTESNVVIQTDISGFAQLEVIDEHHLLAIDENNRAVLYTKSGEKLREWQFGAQMVLQVTSDRQRLVGAAVVSKEEPAPEDHFWDTHYVDYFTTKTIDILSGEILYEVDVNVDKASLSYRSGFWGAEEQLLFSPDGLTFLVGTEDYSEDNAKYGFNAFNTQTGEVRFSASLDASAHSFFAIDNDQFVVQQIRYANDEQSYLQQVAQYSTSSMTPKILWQSNTPVQCDSAELQPAAENTGHALRISINREADSVVGVWKRRDSDFSFCLKTWAISETAESPIIAIDYASDEPWNEITEAAVNTALMSQPVRLYQNGSLSTDINKPVDSVYNNSELLYADKSFIYADKRQLRLPNVAGQIEQIAIDATSGVVWYAAVDRTIRNFAFRGSEQRLNLDLDLFDSQVHVQQEAVFVIETEARTTGNDANEWQHRWHYANALAPSEMQTFYSSGIDQYPEFHLYPNQILGISRVDPNAEDLDQWRRREVSIELIDAKTGVSRLIFTMETNFIQQLAHNSQYIAYLHNDVLQLIDLGSFEQMALPLPAPHTPFEVLVLDNHIVVAASDEHTEEPDKRVITLFRLSPDQKSLQKFAEKQAQGLSVTTMRHANSALLEWDIRYDKPKEYQALHSDLQIQDIQTAWQDEWNLRMLLADDADEIVVVTPDKYVQVFDYAGTLKSETITQGDWWDSHLSHDRKYVYADDEIVPLAERQGCPIPQTPGFGTWKVQMSPGSGFLALADDNLWVMDLRSCTVAYELPIGVATHDNFYITDTGILYLLTETGLQIHQTVQPLQDNIELLRR